MINDSKSQNTIRKFYFFWNFFEVKSLNVLLMFFIEFDFMLFLFQQKILLLPLIEENGRNWGHHLLVFYASIRQQVNSDQIFDSLFFAPRIFFLSIPDIFNKHNSLDPKCVFKLKIISFRNQRRMTWKY